MKKQISRREFIKSSAKAGLIVGFAAPRILKSGTSEVYDIVIKNGTIVDGISDKSYKGDIGIIGEHIKQIGNLQNTTGKTIIDAKSRVVSPGFIDIHTHTDIEILVNRKAESKIRQGVTTELGGNCASSPFPMKYPLSDNVKRLEKKANITIDWTDLKGFHAAINRNGTAINHATLIGQGTLRGYVMGDDQRAPTAEELEQMKKLVAEAMEQGAFGLSTGLEYTPSGFAESQELIELCKIAAKYGGFYASHIRSEDKAALEAVGEAIHIAESAGLPLQIAHFKAVGKTNWWKLPLMIDLVERAAERGLDVTADRYPYIAYSTGLTILFPQWALEGGLEQLIIRLKDAKIRESMKADTLKKVQGYGWEKIVISNLHKKQNQWLIGKSIGEAAASQNADPYEFLCDLIIDEEFNVSHIGFGMDEETTEMVLKHPLVMLGSDGSSLAPYGPLSEGKPHPRNYGTFPRFLGYYVRERKLLTLPEAIKKMTSKPAVKLGLKNRGSLQQGNFADIVIFDPETIADKATFIEPHQYPVGIDYVIVNGTTVIDHGKHTEKLPGKVLYGPGK
ncbi:MAG: D-aminoacylase [Candidatus Aminicenantes bacterium]|nr:MAG: D-aminoacylase [Candidatus Aminicenantes bacterium]